MRFACACDSLAQHDLVDVEVAERDWLDCVIAAGLEAVGFPDTYPRHRNSRSVRHVDCQPVGQAAFDDRRHGIACRSAATGASSTDEELGAFDREVETNVQMTGRHPFSDWFWGAPS